MHTTVEPARKRPSRMQRLRGRRYESRTAWEKFLSQSRMEWYIYSKKNNDKFTLPCELLVVLSTKSLAILCESSFTEVHLIR